MGLGGLAYYVGSSSEVRTVPKEERRVERPVETPPVRSREDEPRRQTSRRERAETLYAVRFLNDEPTLVALSEEAPEGIRKETFVLDRTMRNMGVEGVRILGFRRDKGVGVIDFNAAVEGGMGSMEEAQFVEAIRRTLGQFTGIKAVRFTVEGKPADSFGHGDESGDLPVLRPGEKEKESEEPATEPTDAPAPEPEAPRSTRPR